MGETQLLADLVQSCRLLAYHQKNPNVLDMLHDLEEDFIQKAGPAEATKLRQRVVDELKTTFASHYTSEISLAEALQPEIMAAYNKRATGEKYLINPSKGAAA